MEYGTEDCFWLETLQSVLQAKPSHFHALPHFQWADGENRTLNSALIAATSAADGHQQRFSTGAPAVDSPFTLVLRVVLQSVLALSRAVASTAVPELIAAQLVPVLENLRPLGFRHVSAADTGLLRSLAEALYAAGPSVSPTLLRLLLAWGDPAALVRWAKAALLASEEEARAGVPCELLTDSMHAFCNPVPQPAALLRAIATDHATQAQCCVWFQEHLVLYAHPRSGLPYLIRITPTGEQVGEPVPVQAGTGTLACSKTQLYFCDAAARQIHEVHPGTLTLSKLASLHCDAAWLPEHNWKILSDGDSLLLLGSTTCSGTHSTRFVLLKESNAELVAVHRGELVAAPAEGLHGLKLDRPLRLPLDTNLGKLAKLSLNMRTFPSDGPILRVGPYTLAAVEGRVVVDSRSWLQPEITSAVPIAALRLPSHLELEFGDEALGLRIAGALDSEALGRGPLSGLSSVELLHSGIFGLELGFLNDTSCMEYRNWDLNDGRDGILLCSDGSILGSDAIRWCPVDSGVASTTLRPCHLPVKTSLTLAGSTLLTSDGLAFCLVTGQLVQAGCGIAPVYCHTPDGLLWLHEATQIRCHKCRPDTVPLTSIDTFGTALRNLWRSSKQSESLSCKQFAEGLVLVLAAHRCSSSDAVDDLASLLSAPDVRRNTALSVAILHLLCYSTVLSSPVAASLEVIIDDPTTNNEIRAAAAAVLINSLRVPTERLTSLLLAVGTRRQSALVQMTAAMRQCSPRQVCTDWLRGLAQQGLAARAVFQRLVIFASGTDTNSPQLTSAAVRLLLNSLVLLSVGDGQHAQPALQIPLLAEIFSAAVDRVSATSSILPHFVRFVVPVALCIAEQLPPTADLLRPLHQLLEAVQSQQVPFPQTKFVARRVRRILQLSSGSQEHIMFPHCCNCEVTISVSPPDDVKELETTKVHCIAAKEDFLQSEHRSLSLLPGRQNKQTFSNVNSLSLYVSRQLGPQQSKLLVHCTAALLHEESTGQAHHQLQFRIEQVCATLMLAPLNEIPDALAEEASLGQWGSAKLFAAGLRLPDDDTDAWRDSQRVATARAHAILAKPVFNHLPAPVTQLVQLALVAQLIGGDPQDEDDQLVQGLLPIFQEAHQADLASGSSVAVDRLRDRLEFSAEYLPLSLPSDTRRSGVLNFVSTTDPLVDTPGWQAGLVKREALGRKLATNLRQYADLIRDAPTPHLPALLRPLIEAPNFHRCLEATRSSSCSRSVATGLIFLIRVLLGLPTDAARIAYPYLCHAIQVRWSADDFVALSALPLHVALAKELPGNILDHFQRGSGRAEHLKLLSGLNGWEEPEDAGVFYSPNPWYNHLQPTGVVPAVISPDKLTAEFSAQTMGCIQAAFRWTRRRHTVDPTLFYFEVTIDAIEDLDPKAPVPIWIGLNAGFVALSQCPRKQLSVLYSRSGKAYEGEQEETDFGPCFGVGDVIGCGLDTHTAQAFFTVNGRYLGFPFSMPAPWCNPFDYWPIVGKGENGYVTFRANFGQTAFRFSPVNPRDARQAGIRRACLQSSHCLPAMRALCAWHTYHDVTAQAVDILSSGTTKPGPRDFLGGMIAVGIEELRNCYTHAIVDQKASEHCLKALNKELATHREQFHQQVDVMRNRRGSLSAILEMCRVTSATASQADAARLQGVILLLECADEEVVRTQWLERCTVHLLRLFKRLASVANGGLLRVPGVMQVMLELALMSRPMLCGAALWVLEDMLPLYDQSDMPSVVEVLAMMAARGIPWATSPASEADAQALLLLPTARKVPESGEIVMVKESVSEIDGSNRTLPREYTGRLGIIAKASDGVAVVLFPGEAILTLRLSSLLRLESRDFCAREAIFQKRYGQYHSALACIMLLRRLHGCAAWRPHVSLWLRSSLSSPGLQVSSGDTVSSPDALRAVIALSILGGEPEDLRFGARCCIQQKPQTVCFDEDCPAVVAEGAEHTVVSDVTLGRCCALQTTVTSTRQPLLVNVSRCVVLEQPVFTDDDAVLCALADFVPVVMSANNSRYLNHVKPKLLRALASFVPNHLFRLLLIDTGFLTDIATDVAALAGEDATVTVPTGELSYKALLGLIYERCPDAGDLDFRPRAQQHGRISTSTLLVKPAGVVRHLMHPTPFGWVEGMEQTCGRCVKSRGGIDSRGQFVCKIGDFAFTNDCFHRLSDLGYDSDEEGAFELEMEECPSHHLDLELARPVAGTAVLPEGAKLWTDQDEQIQRWQNCVTVGQRCRVKPSELLRNQGEPSGATSTNSGAGSGIGTLSMETLRTYCGRAGVISAVDRTDWAARVTFGNSDSRWIACHNLEPEVATPPPGALPLFEPELDTSAAAEESVRLSSKEILFSRSSIANGFRRMSAFRLRGHTEYLERVLAKRNATLLALAMLNKWPTLPRWPGAAGLTLLRYANGGRATDLIEASRERLKLELSNAYEAPLRMALEVLTSPARRLSFSPPPDSFSPLQRLWVQPPEGINAARVCLPYQARAQQGTTVQFGDAGGVKARLNGGEAGESSPWAAELTGRLFWFEANVPSSPPDAYVRRFTVEWVLGSVERHDAEIDAALACLEILLSQRCAGLTAPETVWALLTALHRRTGSARRRVLRIVARLIDTAGILPPLRTFHFLHAAVQDQLQTDRGRPLQSRFVQCGLELLLAVWKAHRAAVPPKRLTPRQLECEETNPCLVPLPLSNQTSPRGPEAQGGSSPPHSAQDPWAADDITWMHYVSPDSTPGIAAGSAEGQRDPEEDPLNRVYHALRFLVRTLHTVAGLQMPPMPSLLPTRGASKPLELRSALLGFVDAAHTLLAGYPPPKYLLPRVPPGLRLEAGIVALVPFGQKYNREERLPQFAGTCSLSVTTDHTNDRLPPAEWLSSARANCYVESGCWYYEVELRNPSGDVPFAVGWVTAQALASDVMPVAPLDNLEDEKPGFALVASGYLDRLAHATVVGCRVDTDVGHAAFYVGDGERRQCVHTARLPSRCCVSPVAFVGNGADLIFRFGVSRAPDALALAPLTQLHDTLLEAFGEDSPNTTVNEIHQILPCGFLHREDIFRFVRLANETARQRGLLPCMAVPYISLASWQGSHETDESLRNGMATMAFVLQNFATLVERVAILLEPRAGNDLYALLRAVRPLMFSDAQRRLAAFVSKGIPSLVARRTPEVRINRYRLALGGGIPTFLQLKQQLYRFDLVAMLRTTPLPPFFKVKYLGEGCQDEGGPYREVLCSVAEELTSESALLNLFIPSPNRRYACGPGQDLFVINPATKDQASLQNYEFLGKIFALCLRSDEAVPLRLAPLVWKLLLDEPVALEDIALIDSAFPAFVKWAVESEEPSVSVVFSDCSQVECVPSSVQALVDCRLREAAAQIASVRRGLLSVLPLTALAVLSWQEFEYAICGEPSVTLEALREFTALVAPKPTAELMDKFWAVIGNMTVAQRRRLLQFATGRSVLPATGRGPALLISQLEAPVPDSAFPKSRTCGLLLMLPNYSTPTILAARLEYATQHCNLMDADFNINANDWPAP
eukprot:TRINITY_DN16541_c0_g1_i1.p1 TRINITY_DN16541_c0_g1~~TRINITY_DN16541_c0_g1_i1.p1  ORF type:complete len:3511 (+),score=411.88 TRINITY_DN16541_c0_g1_i1:23-10534(+)